MSRIKQDHSRFRDIVRGRVRDNLRDYISQGELIGKEGGKAVKVPLPQIDLPRFRFSSSDQGGVGQGQGKPGDSLGPNSGKPGDEPGEGEAGENEGEKSLEVEVSIEELAEILGEALELPKIEPKGGAAVVTEKNKYTSIRSVGPDSLRHFKRTYKQALRRTIAMGHFNPKAPVVLPIKDDMRYRSWSTSEVPQSNAVVIYMMDVSGSMGEAQKEIVRIESFWINTWLKSQYKGIETRYIIHDATAKEVDEHTFFHTRESGGTMISSAYKLAWDIICRDYPPSDWNIYPFHFSDGDNWSSEDTRECLELMEQHMIPASNQFSYGQVESHYGSGQFLRDLKKHFSLEDPNVSLVCSEIKNKDEIVDSIKHFLGAGR
jgi:hypothetical protein